MLILEDLRTVRRRRLFQWLGVEWMATPWAWWSVPFLVGWASGWLSYIGRHPPT